MYEFITEKTLAEYEAFVQSHPKGNFAQSYLWGKQKPMWKWDAIVVRVMTARLPLIAPFSPRTTMASHFHIGFCLPQR